MATDPTGLRPAAARSGDGPDPESGPADRDAPTPLERRFAPVTETRASRAKVTGPRRSRARKVRRVHRVIRHVEIWSVFKVTSVFVVCGYLMTLIAGYLLWRAADRVGTIDGIEGFMEDAGGYDRFELAGGTVFRVATLGGLVLAVAVVGLAVLSAVLFNLISDLVGGIRMTVIDEDLVVVPARMPAGTGTADGPRPAPAGDTAAPAEQAPPEDEPDSAADTGDG